MENEIEVLESIVYDLESVINEAQDSQYFAYKVDGWKEDIEEIKERLDELYSMQDMEWHKEINQLNYEFERGAL